MAIILLDFKEEMYPETLCGAIMRISDDILIIVRRISSLPAPLSDERQTALSHSTGYINGVSVKKWVDCLGISLKQIWVLALCLLICLPRAQTFEISSPVIVEYEILNTWTCKAENMSSENCPSQSDERAVINNCGFKCKEGTHPKCVRVETWTRYICSETNLSCPPGKRRRAMLDKNDLKKVKVVEEDCPNDYYQPTPSGCYDDACQFKQGDIDNIPESFLVLHGNTLSCHKLYCNYINGYYNLYGKTFIPASDLMYDRDFCTHISERNPCTETNISLLPNGTCVVPCASGFVRDAWRSFICVSENDPIVTTVTQDMEESLNNKNVNHESALDHNVDKDHHDKEQNTDSTRSVTIANPVDSKDKGEESDSHPTLIRTVLISVLGTCLAVIIISVAYICWKNHRADGNEDSPGDSTNDVESQESNSGSELKDETMGSLQEPLLEQTPKTNEPMNSKDDNSDIHHTDIPLRALKNTTEPKDSQVEMQVEVGTRDITTPLLDNNVPTAQLPEVLVDKCAGHSGIPNDDKHSQNRTEVNDRQFLNGDAGTFKNSQDVTIDQLFAAVLLKLMESVGVIIHNGCPIGTVFRVGQVYVMTAFHVVENIITDPKRNMAVDPKRLELDENLFIHFEASVCTLSHSIEYKAKLTLWDQSGDVAILEIINPSNLPEPLLLWQHQFNNLHQTHLLAIGFGHPSERYKKHSEKCKIIWDDPNRYAKMIDNLEKMKDIYKASLNMPDTSLLDQSYDDYFNSNIIKLDLYMGKGLSGGPVITIDPKSPKVVGIILGGKPEFFYKLPHALQDEFPSLCCFEVAAKMEKLYEIISRDRELTRNIFTE